MSDVVRLVDLPDLGVVTAGSRAAGARTGAGLFAVDALREYIVPGAAENVRSWGATGNGVDDDTAAFKSALDTGRCVVVPEGTYKITDGLVLAASGQRLIGAGERATTIVPVGSFDVITMQDAAEQVGVSGIGFECEGMGGGYVVATRNADRVVIKDLLINDPWSVALVERCNAYAAHSIYVQRPRGPYGWHCSGPPGVRSDVVRLSHVNIGGRMDERVWTGVYIDGEVHTVLLNLVTFVAPLIGVHVAHTSGGAVLPHFLIGNDVEVDFPLEESIRLDEIHGVWLTNVYAQGSETTAGISIGAGADSVKITNGYIRGARREGVVIEGADVSLVNCQVVFNGYPSFFDYDAVRVAGTAERVQLTACALGGLRGVGAVARYGVGVAAGARDIRLTGCDFYGCAAGAVDDQSEPLVPGNVTQVGGGASDQLIDTLLPGLQLGVNDGEGALFSANVVGGAVTSVTVLAGGGGYQLPPQVFAWSATTGTGFVGTCVLTDGVVTSVVVNNPGGGYPTDVALFARSGLRVPSIKARWPGQPNTSLSLAADGTGGVVLENDEGRALLAGAQADAASYLSVLGLAGDGGVAMAVISTEENAALSLSAKGTAQIVLNGPVAMLSLISTGSVYGSSITSGGAINGGSLSVTGAITGASLGVTGTITGASLSVTGAITGGSLAASGTATVLGLSTLGSLSVTGGVGFYGTTPIAKPALDGNWAADPAAMGKKLSIILSQLGLITDNSINA